MDKLTAKEKKWIAEVNEVLARCPSKRLGFFTTGGDRSVNLYDRKHQKGCDDEGGDLVCYLNARNAHIEETLIFPCPVEGVCG